MRTQPRPSTLNLSTTAIHEYLRDLAIFREMPNEQREIKFIIKCTPQREIQQTCCVFQSNDFITLFKARHACAKLNDNMQTTVSRIIITIIIIIIIQKRFINLNFISR